MSSSTIKDMPKKAGRPATGKDPMIGFRSPVDLTQRIDQFASRIQAPRAEAIRQLIVRGLDAE